MDKVWLTDIDPGLVSEDERQNFIDFWNGVLYEFKVGDLVWTRPNGDDEEQFEVEDRKLTPWGAPRYKVDGRWISCNFIIGSKRLLSHG